MTVEDFMRQMNGLGERVGRMDLHLLEVSGEILNDMKARLDASIVRGSTGDLSDSMKRYVENHRLRFTMLYYGPFQNYGVKGAITSQNVKPVQFGVLPRPASGVFYQFKNVPLPVGGPLSLQARWTIRRQGLKPKDFFDINDMRDKIQKGIQERLDNLK